MKEDITIEGDNDANKRNNNLTFKNNAPFINCISKINGVKIDNIKITDTKLYVPVVTLSKENDTKLLEKLKTGFKRTIKWNKYRSQTTVQPKNNNLNYLIDPTFTNVNRLFVLSFQRIAGENNTTKDYRDSFSHYYVPNARIKDFNVLIDGKVWKSNNNDYTTGNLLDFSYF